MFLVRFSYEIQPVNRDQAMDFIRGEVVAAKKQGLVSRLLIPLTRGHGGPALQFEVELKSLDQLETLRHRRDDGSDWMEGFSKILLSPPLVEILRVEDSKSAD